MTIKPKYMIAADFKVNGHTLSGIYETESKMVAARLTDFNLKTLAPDDVADFIPDITVNSLLYAFKPAQPDAEDPIAASQLIKADLGFDISLADLPFVGDQIPQAEMFALNGLTIQANRIESHWVGDKLIEAKTDLQMTAVLNLGGNTIELALPLTRDDFPAPKQPATGIVNSSNPPSNDGGTSSTTNNTAVVARDNTKLGKVKWFEVNKTIGSGQLKRIGLQFYQNKVHFLLDMQVAIGPLTIGLDGLSVGSPIDQISPEFGLSGLSLSYAKGPTTISGAFLRDEVADAYAGTVLIKTPGLNMAAMGAYQEIDGQPSVFIYGVMNLAVGLGPPFMQVTGIAAGFGYNRTVNIPEIDQIGQFPLVSAAMGKGDSDELGTDPLAVLSKIKSHVPAALGESFLAFGIKFNSFKLIDSFALVLLRLGNKVKLDLLGLARLEVPNKSLNPLAVVEMAIKASYDFDESVLKVQAELTSASYILSKQCRLTGGFAFYSWFDGDNAGDFVLTLGGYHPDFTPPAHYPTVPRLGFHWQLSPGLSLKGGMYYALLPGALMAGGNLRALFEEPFSVGFDLGVAGATLSGKVKAYFVIGADFIIAWEPYYYDARVYMSVGISASFRGTVKFLFFSASYEASFDVSLSADLHIWGPEFSGTAYVDFSVVSFDIAFGAEQVSAPPKSEWADFEKAFLPSDGAICHTNVEDGLLKQTGDDIFVIDPATLVLTTSSVIPSMQLTAGNASFAEFDRFGVPCMHITEVAQAEHQIRILDDSDNSDVTDEFEYTPIAKSAPCALWGTSNCGSDNQLIKNLLMGCRITPKPKQAPDKTEQKPLGDFAYDIELRSGAYQWSDGLNVSTVGDTEEGIAAIAGDSQTNNRDEILLALGLETAGVNLDGLTGNIDLAFLVSPQIVTGVVLH
ncbi:MAG: hypothetical protein HRT35_18475 [Algicola sp.]|nr:hypothetical protein [Algicola sp.]